MVYAKVAKHKKHIAAIKRLYIPLGEAANFFNSSSMNLCSSSGNNRDSSSMKAPLGFGEEEDEIAC